AVPPGLVDTQTTESALQQIAAAQATAGDLPAAFRTLRADPMRPNAEVLTAIVRNQALGGDVAGAVRTAGLARDARGQDQLLLEAARGLMEAGNVSGAFTAISLSPNVRQDPDARPVLALLHARTGNLPEALRLAKGIDRQSDRVVVIMHLAPRQARAG